jgi:hypothetical protein
MSTTHPHMTLPAPSSSSSSSSSENKFSESRRFRMHHALLFDVIKSQAGSLQKALTELVMNSVDAGASSVEITLDRNCFCVKDDGKGFAGRDEIDAFFETFGTPHVEGDAVFGRFRMGRGQAFAFARNRWRTGTFEMRVDIQGRGLDYDLITGCEPVVGCTINGDLYERLDPSELLSIARSLAEQCQYLPIPLSLNGKVINRLPESERWTHTDDSAYVRVDDSRRLSLFNLGVLVAHYPASEFGVGGVVVSKRQLAVNFARNDVLRSQCPEWRAIRPLLTRLAAEHCGRTKGAKKTEAWREFQARQVLTTALTTSEQVEELRGLPLFTDVAGKHLSLKQLGSSRLPIVVAPTRKSLMADRLQQAKLAMVLDPGTFDRFGSPLVDVLAILHNLVAQAKGRARDAMYWSLEAVRRDIIDVQGLASRSSYDALAATLNSDHEVLPQARLPKDAAAALRAIESASYLVAMCLRLGAGLEGGSRRIRAMASETADAYTDGMANIFINIRFLRGADGPSSGIGWASRMAALLVHEQAHDFDSGVGHGHDAAFFEAFHAGVSDPTFGRLVDALFANWSREAVALGKTSMKVLRQMDATARLADAAVVQSPAAIPAAAAQVPALAG